MSFHKGRYRHKTKNRNQRLPRLASINRITTGVQVSSDSLSYLLPANAGKASFRGSLRARHWYRMKNMKSISA